MFAYLLGYKRLFVYLVLWYNIVNCMLVLFTKSNKLKSSRSDFVKVTNYLNQYRIPYKVVTHSNLTKDDLYSLLKNTTEGFDEVLKRGRSHFIHDLSFDDAITTILENTSILKDLILFDGKKLVASNPSENIRVFIPRNYRSLARLQLISELPMSERDAPRR